MLLATDILEARIKDIREMNKQAVIAQGGKPEDEDLDPSLVEIQETHMIHFQSRFKPYVC